VTTTIRTKLAKEARLFGIWVFSTCIVYGAAYLARALVALITVPVIADILGMTKEAVVGLVLTWIPNWLLLAVSALLNAGLWHSERQAPVAPPVRRTPRSDTAAPRPRPDGPSARTPRPDLH
jgi:hypothetical protein